MHELRSRLPRNGNNRKHDSRKLTREEARTNRLMIKMLNVFFCLEIPMQRFSFKSTRLSLYLAHLRFIFFALMAIKYLLISILDGPEYSNFRRLIGDWTLVYPNERRQALLRLFTVTCLVHLATKMSVFNRRAFDSSLFDYLSASPALTPVGAKAMDASRKLANKSSQYLMIGGGHEKQSFDAILSSIELHRRLLMQPDVPLMSSWAAKHPNARYKSSNGYPDWDTSWKTQAMRPSFPRLGSQILPIFIENYSSPNQHGLFADIGGGGGGGSSCCDCIGNSMADFDFEINRDAEHWHLVGRTLRRSFICASIVSCLSVGPVLLVATIRIAVLKNPDQLITVSTLLRIIGMCEVAFLLAETLFHLIGLVALLLCVCADLNRQLTISKRYLGELIALVDISRSYEFDKSFIDVASGDNYHHHHQQQRQQQLPAARSDDQLDRFGSRGSLLSSQPTVYDPLLRDFVVTLRSVKPDPINANRGARDESLTSPEHVMREAQSRMTGALICLENHKRLLAFLGNSSYLWFLACLSFVPLIATIRTTTREAVVAVSLYYTISTIATVAYFLFASITARINHRATNLGRLIFQICARYPDREAIMHWHKVMYIWFCPSRCAVRVLGLLNLTYVNILKSLSYLISGVTLMLNFMVK